MPVPSNEVVIGRQLETAETAALTLIAAGGTQNLFTVAGGSVYLEDLIGFVTLDITATGTIISHLEHIAVDMCLAIAGLDLAGVVDGSIITITGAVAAAAVATITGVVVAPSFMTNHVIVGPGVIRLITIDGGMAGDIAGAIRWSVVYRPLQEGAYVIPA